LEEKTMSHLSRPINNPILTDDYASPASDSLLGELDELEPEPYTSSAEKAFGRLPLRMAENVTAFEEADLLAPTIPDERAIREPQTIFLTLPSRKTGGGYFTYVVITTSTATCIPVEDPFGPSPYQARFSPDFYSIKRFVTYVMQGAHTPLLQQPQALKTTRDIPVAIDPQVVREAEEETLIDDLEAAISLAQETYFTLNKIEINIEHDPEIVGRKTIRFTLTVSGEPDTVLENEALFKKHLRGSISSSARELITVTYSWEKDK
jgi:hypothetical protein